jgi:hypothetical protein
VRRTVRIVQQSRPAQRNVRGEAGQASVELALTITMTLLLIFALIDFSRAIYTASIIQWAAQRGARAAIIDPTQEFVEAAVKERLVGLDPELVVVEFPAPVGNVVEVRVTYPFDFVAPIVEQITGDGIEMSSSASMIAH